MAARDDGKIRTIVGAIEDPRVLLLGRIDGRSRRLRYVARTVPLALSLRSVRGRTTPLYFDH
ncbi:hypothetical protein [Actinoplanes auranticolor]|uniref:Uncharacterized protein n=1 Tax=Actinoplanes auranticolor TaxID=47988 RepID=A0A919SUV9_9ACTN|nr:hypothetical protein [Actinoplanes auranticolor]GIM77822.1 hypothetical protein Aau02nite_77830 [Actinoplanes auranticolor]